MKYYSPIKKCVVFTQSNATAVFWDSFWAESDNAKNDISKIRSTWITAIVTQYLSPEDGPIIEGGCGCAEHVAALANNKYSVIGIDWAKETVRSRAREYPQFDVRVGDVRELPFPDGHFAGYLSLGVIEHFEEGAREIFLEMMRVVKDDGYLFLAFPYMSPIRKFKSWIRSYPLWPSPKMPKDFYQFALDTKAVVHDLREFGFRLVESIPMDMDNGTREELPAVHAMVTRLLAYRGKNILIRGVRRIMLMILPFFAGHSVLLILKKTRLK
ncbi:MAG: class I SAM-dependent methyltransferase [Candidatus Omnitrophica bacterium]|nr:class I SAM-dependent methyltransferase [Candidatus Omnitrophota bacterium]